MADETVPDDRDRALYLTQIQFLDKELERCQLRCDELKKLIDDLRFWYGAMGRDRDDICNYLTDSSNAVERKVAELSKVLEHQQQADEKETDELKLHLNQQKEELQKEVDTLMSKNTSQKEKLDQQQKERGRMTERLAYVEFIEKQLYTTREEYEAAIAKLQKRLDLHWAKVFQDCEKQVWSSIKNKVSANVEEEKIQHAEVLKQVKELTAASFKLLKEKSILQCQESEVCLEVQNMKRDSHTASQDIIQLKEKEEQLSKKCQQLKVRLNNYSLLLAKKQDLRQQLNLDSEVCSQKKAEAAQLEAELQEEMSRRRQLKADMEKATNILRRAVMGLEKFSEAQGKIQKLREILESNTSHGTESALYTSPEKSSRGQKLQTSGPGTVSPETLKLGTDPLFLLSRYRPGDLGFLPRPRWRKPGCHKASIAASDDRSNPSDLASRDTHAEAGPSTSTSLLNPNPARK
ncbi:cilia- and flagella-associated protein 157-like isoform X2 [Neolamprologus brichardi]|uniref:cilia- and flagella-associated protein 157-like isoform X2 n=1 Tax=Neolamprologus brichardi TaxID=32507 RepID=UPI0003EC47F5|nr:cilia- and flagella-associated protein 157-like isoform X2 [Neolamprologus brichardi]